MQEDEVAISDADFMDGTIPKTSKLMLRKTFVVSKDVVLKRYGTLCKESFQKYHELFCSYFHCHK